ncbi:MAG TPA: FHA domain-containing protein [Allocoleopsis sp.]
MSTYQCPKGHESTESDYCSECGAKIKGSPELALAQRNDVQHLASNPVASAVFPASQGTVNCPDCSAPHDPDSGNFCEICGYNFISRAHGEVPPVAVEKATANSIASTPDLDSTNSGSTRSSGNATADVPDSPAMKPSEDVAIAFEVIATIDPSLREAGSPAPPTNQKAIAFTLDKPSNLIGRRSELRGVHPDVALDFDDAVSHRHALLNRQPDGTLMVRDIGSTNGTRLNGVELTAMVDTPIQEGDELTLGHWTRLIIKVLRSGE